MAVIFDTDILSAFAKTDNLHLLKRLFSKHGEKEQEIYREFLRANRRIGKGELEAICICINRKYYISSMDEAAISFSEANNVTTISLRAILRALWESGILTKKEVQELILQIEQKDNTRIKDIQKILQ